MINSYKYCDMHKITIDMGSLDHLLNKSHGKFNIIANMSLP